MLFFSLVFISSMLVTYLDRLKIKSRQAGLLKDQSHGLYKNIHIHKNVLKQNTYFFLSSSGGSETLGVVYLAL